MLVAAQFIESLISKYGKHSIILMEVRGIQRPASHWD